MVEQNSTTNHTNGRPLTTATSETRSILVTFLELVCGRWLLIGTIFFSAVFWSYMAVIQAPETYEGTAQVLIRRGRIQAVRSEPILRQQEDVGSELDILVSISVLEESVRQLLEQSGLRRPHDSAQTPLIFDRFESTRPAIALTPQDLPTSEPARLFSYLEKRIRAEKFGESNVIEVSLVSVSPRFAAAAVNTLIDVYEKYHLTVDQSHGQSSFFSREIDKIDSEINELQRRLAEYMQERGVADPEKDIELLALRRHALTLELDDLQVDKAALETDLQSVTDANRHPPFIRQDMSIQRLREMLFRKQAEVGELRSQLQANHPAVRAKEEELEDLRQRLASEEELAVRQQQHIYRQLKDKETELKGKIAAIDERMGHYPMLQAEIDRLDRDIKQRTMKRVDIVEQMFKSTTFEQPDQSLSKVRVLGYAQVPEYPREARKGFKFAVAVLLSLMAAIVIAILVEGLDHSIRRREEIEEQLNVPYLASISTHSP